MNYGIYAIYDTKTEAYAAPFAQPNNAVAMRMFSDLANDPNTNIHKHASDFRLARLGTWDDVTGKFEPEEETTIAWAVDFADEQIT